MNLRRGENLSKNEEKEFSSSPSEVRFERKGVEQERAGTKGEEGAQGIPDTQHL